MSDRPAQKRLLVVAARPFQLSDLGPEVAATYEIELIRRADVVDRVIDQFVPHIALVDTGLREGKGFAVIERLESHDLPITIVALTPDPPPHDHVALAARAGAAGFIDIDASDEEFAAALDSVASGESWYPAADVREILAAVASDLDTTAAERRSRLTGIILALIPLTGLVAALQASLWRRYLGSIGVRPIDLAVDPATRVIDAVAVLLLVVAIVGPLLFMRNWLDILAESRLSRGPLVWLQQHRTAAHVVLSLLWLGIAAVLAIGPDVVLVVFVGPMVTVAIIAKALGVNDELPPVLRIDGVSSRVAVGGSILTLLLVFGVLVYETLVVGPDLRTNGVHGLIAPRVLGISAQPVEAINVDTGERRGVLYLGGNADLYVLVDPCRDNQVDMVSVGSHRLVVIDEISCSTAGG